MTPHDSPPELVSVFESTDALVIGLAQGLLEDSGIPFWMQGDPADARRGIGPIPFPSSRFLVPKDREAEARELLQVLQSPDDQNSSFG